MPNTKKSKSPLAASYASSSQSSGPKWVATPHLNGVALEHTEYIGGAVIGENLGANIPKSQIVNPANAELFPYLAGIAQNFERWRGWIKFEFRTTRGTTDNGSIYFAIDTDANDVPPATITEMMRNARACSGPVYRDLSVECSSNKWRLVKTVASTNFAVNGSENLFSCGLFLAALAGFDTGSSPQFGDLFVHYRIELKEPTVTPNFSVSGESRQTKVQFEQAYANGNNAPLQNAQEIAPNFVEMITSDDGKIFLNEALSGTLVVDNGSVTLDGNGAGGLREFIDFLAPQQGSIVKELATVDLQSNQDTADSFARAGSAFNFITNNANLEQSDIGTNEVLRYGTLGAWHNTLSGGVPPDPIDRLVTMFDTAMQARDVASFTMAQHLQAPDGHAEVSHLRRVPVHLQLLQQRGFDYSVGIWTKDHQFVVRRDASSGKYSVKYNGTIPTHLVSLISGDDEIKVLDAWRASFRQAPTQPKA